MLRSILTGVGTLILGSKVQSWMRHAAYGAAVAVMTLTALVFVSLALFYWLSEPIGQAGAAAAVSAFLALLAGLVFLWSASRARRQEESNSLLSFAQAGLSRAELLKDVPAVIERARSALRKAGPVKVSLGALAVGFILSRLR